MVLFSHQFIYYSANDEINTHTSDSYILTFLDVVLYMNSCGR